MKIHKLSVIIFLSLYSCTSSPIQNISPSNSPPKIEKTAVATSQSVITPNHNISSIPSVNPTNTPDSEISPSNTPSVDPNIKTINIVSEDNNIMSKTNFKDGNNISDRNNLQAYNMLPNEKKKFKLNFEETNEIKEDNIVWSSSNIDIAIVDNTGLVSSTSKNNGQDLIGSTMIKASLKSSPEKSVSFPVNLYNRLERTSEKSDMLCKSPQVKFALPRYEPVVYGSTGQVTEKSEVSGKIYDKNKNLLDNVTITVNIDDLEFATRDGKTCNELSQKTINNSYYFNDIFTGTEIIITASKEGYISKSRKVVTKSNLTGDPNANVFNFGGENQNNYEFALEKVQN